MTVVADIEVVVKKDDSERKKKKSKKRKHEEVEETTTPDVDDSEKKKKKKNKHEEVEETTTPDVDDSEKKKKKKKNKHEEVEETTAPDVDDSDKKKKKKKHDNDDEKKDKKKDKKSKHSSQDTPSSEISSYLSKHNITIDQPSPSAFPSFTHLNPHLPPSLQSFWQPLGFSEPSPIQACCWPIALEGHDLVGVAETGSGKTLAFGIPALVKLILSKKEKEKKNTTTITTLILSPTRELALQTHDQLVSLGEPLGIGCVAVFGGVGKEQQVKLLQNLHQENKKTTTRIIVGTPGRILDLMNDGVCDLSRVNFLVLDEADRMLDKGFEQDIRKIIARTIQGEERQTLMFSATWPEAVRRLATSFQKNPVRVTVGSDDLTANSRVEQVVEVLEDGRQKENRLFNHLRSLGHPKQPSKNSSSTTPDSRILIFALYKAEASRLSSTLSRAGYSTSSLHGDLSQQARLQALQDFKQGKTGLMVATDVAARGLDIPDVRVVINYTFPLGIEDYIHRIGRTGRGGKTGKSITFFTGENHEKSLAGELNRVLAESGFDCKELREKFPMTIKKKEHSAYGAFYRDDIGMATGRKKIVFGDD